MADLTWLDRSIGWFAPTWGAKRAQARATTHALLSYEGARVGRREKGWIAGSNSANSEISADRITLRNRARSLLRDNAYAVKGAQTLVANRIGTGILASADGPNKRLNKRLQDAYWAWADHADITGRTDLYGIQSQAERARVESGEVFLRFVGAQEPQYPGDPGLRLQLLEAEVAALGRRIVFEDGQLKKPEPPQGAPAAPVAIPKRRRPSGDSWLGDTSGWLK